MGRFKSPGQAQRFLADHDQVQTVFALAVTHFPLNHIATPEPMLTVFGMISPVN